MPVHNTRFLRSTLESIDNSKRTQGDWQLVVVLDRVNPIDVEILLPNSMQGINVKVLSSKKPGIVEALNLGLTECEAEIVARIDEDDLVYPDRFIAQLKYLKSHPETVAVGGALNLVDENGRQMGKVLYPISDKSIRKVAFNRSPIAHPACTFRKTTVLEVGGYRKGVPEDWDLWIRLLQVGKLHNLGKVVISYRQHSAQLSRTSLYNIRRGRRLILAGRQLSESDLENLPSDYSGIENWINESAQFRTLEIQSLLNSWKKLEKFENLKLENSRNSTPMSRLVFVRMFHFPILTLNEIFLKILSRILL
jgi:glycosyltransferase involved in cell wall biosynthesis